MQTRKGGNYDALHCNMEELRRRATRSGL